MFFLCYMLICYTEFDCICNFWTDLKQKPIVVFKENVNPYMPLDFA